MTARTILELGMVVALAGMVVSVLGRLATGRLRAAARCPGCGGPASRAYPRCRHCGFDGASSAPVESDG